MKTVTKRISLSITIATLAIFALVATVAAADPTPGAGRGQGMGGDTIPAILGLTHEQVMDLRHDGLTLAQIAERQKVDPQRLIDALVANWSARIDARVANGALTTQEATALKEQLVVRATAMVNQAPLGGMRGDAVGAGGGQGRGAGMGNGAAMGPGSGSGRAGAPCDGSGAHGRFLR